MVRLLRSFHLELNGSADYGEIHAGIAAGFDGVVGDRPGRSDGVDGRKRLVGRTVGGFGGDSQVVQILDCGVSLLLGLGGAADRWRTLHVRACPDGLADVAVGPDAESL